MYKETGKKIMLSQFLLTIIVTLELKNCIFVNVPRFSITYGM